MVVPAWEDGGRVNSQVLSRSSQPSLWGWCQHILPEAVSSQLLHFKLSLHIPQKLFWGGVSRAPSSADSTRDKALCVCVCVCVCLSVCLSFLSTAPHLAGLAPQTKDKVRMPHQTQALALGRRGWREGKIIAQFQACSRLSEFNNP